MMKKSFTREIRRINYLTTETDALYHLANLHLGIADSASLVLYFLYDADGRCPLSDIYKSSGTSKQTVNSAIRGLEKEGALYLEPYKGRAKMAVLTDKGRAYAENTVARLRRAELQAFDGWTEEEVDTHIRLLEKYARCFRREVEKI